MAMIKCSECGTEVSDKAEKCPKCACPISSQVSASKVQVIEQTSKKLKKQVLLSVIAIVIGIFVLISSFGDKSAGQMTFGTVLFFAGIIWFFVVKIKIWWHHK